jgi:hypothetical protein
VIAARYDGEFDFGKSARASSIIPVGLFSEVRLSLLLGDITHSVLSEE